MAKKNQAIVAVIDGVTPTQAANIQADIIKSKAKHAESARGTIALGNRQDIGTMIDSGQKDVGLNKIKEIESGEAK